MAEKKSKRKLRPAQTVREKSAAANEVKPVKIKRRSLVELLGALSVVVLICVSIVKRNWVELMLNLFAYLFFSLTFGLITRLTYHKHHFINYLFWPLFFGLDLFIMNRSMWRYELGNVLWKGRSIGPSVLSQGTLTNSSDVAPH